MALTVTSRGTGTHNTGATTLVPGGRSATLAVGSMGVLCIALDNAGASGGALIAPASWTDAKGNVWTLRQPALYDNGSASSGIEMAFYTAPITVALLTSDAGTITWQSGASPVAKVWTWYEVIPSGSNKVAYGTGGTIAGATAANAQVTTGTIEIGNAVIAGYFSENTGAVTGDADTTNGTWTTQQTTNIGSTTSGVIIATQQKVQTTAASTQSYDVTVASQDRIAGWVGFVEIQMKTGTAESGAGTDASVRIGRTGTAESGTGTDKSTALDSVTDTSTDSGTGVDASVRIGLATRTDSGTGLGTANVILPEDILHWRRGELQVGLPAWDAWRRGEPGRMAGRTTINYDAAFISTEAGAASDVSALTAAVAGTAESSTATDTASVDFGTTQVVGSDSGTATDALFTSIAAYLSTEAVDGTEVTTAKVSATVESGTGAEGSGGIGLYGSDSGTSSP